MIEAVVVVAAAFLVVVTNMRPRYMVPTLLNFVKTTLIGRKYWWGNTVKMNKKIRLPSLRYGRNAIAHSLLLLTGLTSLGGCSSKPSAPVVNCPELVEILETLPEPSFPRAQAYSGEVLSLLREVADWLSK